SRPGPRKLVPEVRLALSKLDLKMKLMPSAEVISLSWPATSSCSCMDSITHGPAIRKIGWSRPTSKPQSFMGISPEHFCHGRTRLDAEKASKNLLARDPRSSA